MSKIKVTTQSELDNVDINTQSPIVIDGGNWYNPIIISKLYPNTSIEVIGTSVIEMWENSQVNYMRENSQVKEMRENSQVNYMWENSQVNYMWGNSQVKEMRGNSQVNYMWGNSQVKEMWGNSQVKEMWGNSQVNYMRENSQVKEMRENSQVNYMRENSQVKEMYGTTSISNAIGSNKITTFGYNIIKTTEKNKKNLQLSLSKDSYLFIIPEYDITSLDEFSKHHPVKHKTDGTLIVYKAVHKNNDGKYVSHYDNKFIYTIGEIKEHPLDPQQTQSCSKGLHISGLAWALKFGFGWDDLAILEMEVNENDILIASDTDGKFRTSKLTVIREVPREEWYS